jgi:dienelactone hydrolase
MVEFTSEDGFRLLGRLTLPTTGKEKYPVVFYLGGSGASFTHWPVGVPDEPNKFYDYTQFYASQLALRGVAFFRMNKRGCEYAPDEGGIAARVDREVFSKTTLDILLEDYRAGLTALKEQPEIDSTQVALMGVSEGTILAPRLALKQTGIRAIAMLGYVEDGYRDVLRYAATTGRWRTIKRMFDVNDDDVVTKEEYEEADPRHRKAVTPLLLWMLMDENKDGKVTRHEVIKFGADNYDETVYKDADYVWNNNARLNPELLRLEWKTGNRHRVLLELDKNVQLGIFQGELDAAAAIEGVRRTEQAFKAARRKNLYIRTYESTDHELGFHEYLYGGSIPQGYTDMFDFVAAALGTK